MTQRIVGGARSRSLVVEELIAREQSRNAQRIRIFTSGVAEKQQDVEQRVGFLHGLASLRSHAVTLWLSLYFREYARHTSHAHA